MSFTSSTSSGSGVKLGPSDNYEYKVPTKKPKGAISAYAYFLKHQGQFVRGTGFVPSDFSKECGQIWKGLTEEQKKPFMDLALQDKGRYAYEMQDYVPNEEELANMKVKKDDKNKGDTIKRVAKRKRDPDAPKLPSSSYIWFCKNTRAIIKGEHPDLSPTEVSKELGRRWGLLSDEDKAPYAQSAILDRQRYNSVKLIEEMEMYDGIEKKPVKRVKKGEPKRMLTKIWFDEDDDEDDFVIKRPRVELEENLEQSGSSDDDIHEN